MDGYLAAGGRPGAVTAVTADDRMRRIAGAAAVGAGGLVGIGSALVGVAVGVGVVQALAARRAIGPRRAAAPYADGRYLPPGVRAARGVSLRLAVLGDSSAAGLGASGPDATPGALLARGLAAAADRPVVLTNVASVGARSRDLAAQVQRALHVRPDVAVLLIGANDVTHMVTARTSVRLLGEAVRALREAGSQVVVGTCPDLGTVRPIPQPLRAYAGRASRELAAAQAIMTARAGGFPVRLGHLLGPDFDADPELFFSDDRFHPSDAGYAACVSVLLPAAVEALELAPDLPSDEGAVVRLA